MTREEAIEIIRNYDVNGCGYCHQGGNEVEEAFDMAIEALEQEPCEDAISRKAVLNTLEFCDKALDVDRTVESYKSLLAECYKVLPSVQPISTSVIEDIKADIAELMAKIPALGNCKEGWHNAGQRIGLEQACEIIDNHIAESEDKE